MLIVKYNLTVLFFGYIFVGAPCLSFDILKDNLGEKRESFPLTSYMVAGTQAETAHVNFVILMKMSNLHRIGKKDKADSEDEVSDEESDDEEDEPELTTAMMKHAGTVNRIRVRSICALVLWGGNMALHI